MRIVLVSKWYILSSILFILYTIIYFIQINSTKYLLFIINFSQNLHQKNLDLCFSYLLIGWYRKHDGFSNTRLSSQMCIQPWLRFSYTSLSSVHLITFLSKDEWCLYFWKPKQGIIIHCLLSNFILFISFSTSKYLSSSHTSNMLPNLWNIPD